jgi:hypothetical protein
MAVWDVDLVKDEVTGTSDLNRLLGFPEDEPLDVEAVRAGYYRANASGLEASSRPPSRAGGPHSNRSCATSGPMEDIGGSCCVAK